MNDPGIRELFFIVPDIIFLLCRKKRDRQQKQQRTGDDQAQPPELPQAEQRRSDRQHCKKQKIEDFLHKDFLHIGCEKIPECGAEPFPLLRYDEQRQIVCDDRCRHGSQKKQCHDSKGNGGKPVLQETFPRLFEGGKCFIFSSCHRFRCQCSISGNMASSRQSNGVKSSVFPVFNRSFKSEAVKNSTPSNSLSCGKKGPS